MPEETRREKITALIEDRFRRPHEKAGLIWDNNFNYMLVDDILALLPHFEPDKDLAEQVTSYCKIHPCSLHLEEEAAKFLSSLRLVQLAEDQTPPQNPYLTCHTGFESKHKGYSESQQDMLKSGWCKVKEG